jgi:hypothetical protein
LELDGAYAGSLCIWERWSGGGRENVGRLLAAERRAVRLCVSIMEDDCEVHDNCLEGKEGRMAATEEGWSRRMGFDRRWRSRSDVGFLTTSPDSKQSCSI